MWERKRRVLTTLTPMISPLAFLTFFNFLCCALATEHWIASSRRCAPEEVPEARLCDNIVDRKDTHPVDLGSRLGLGGEMPPDNLVFRQAHLRVTCDPAMSRGGVNRVWKEQREIQVSTSSQQSRIQKVEVGRFIRPALRPSTSFLRSFRSLPLTMNRRQQ